jgi:hypothetical protein
LEDRLNVQEAVTRTGEVATPIEAVSQGAGDAGAASLQALSRESSHLKIEVGKFVHSVQA